MRAGGKSLGLKSSREMRIMSREEASARIAAALHRKGGVFPIRPAINIPGAARSSKGIKMHNGGDVSRSENRESRDLRIAANGGFAMAGALFSSLDSTIRSWLTRFARESPVNKNVETPSECARAADDLRSAFLSLSLFFFTGEFIEHEIEGLPADRSHSKRARIDRAGIYRRVKGRVDSAPIAASCVPRAGDKIPRVSFYS